MIKIIMLMAVVISLLGYILNLYKILFVPVVFLGSIVALIILWILACFICTRFINMGKDYEEESKFYWLFAYGVIELASWLSRVNLLVSGEDILPEEKFMLVCNHNAAMDPLITMGLLRKYKLSFVARHEIYRIPIISRLMHRCNCLCLNRDDIKESAKTIIKASNLIKEDKASIGIYPEGARNVDKEMLPFMHGAFKIAKKADCPIVVATIKNTEKLIKRAPFRKTDVYLDFIGVIDEDFIRENNTVQISNKARAMMEANLA